MLSPPTGLLKRPAGVVLILICALVWLLPAPDGALAGGVGGRAKAIAERYGTGPIESGDRRWTSAELDLLEATLGRLNSTERQVLRGVRFVRKRRGFRPGHAGLYKTDAQGNRIYIFDLAFRGASSRGRANATIGHEIGHAVCFWDLRIANNNTRKAVDRYNKAVEDFNGLVRRYNRSGRSDRERLAKKIDDKREEFGPLKKKVRRAKQRQRQVGRSFRSLRPRDGVLHDYQKSLAGKRGPTAYGRRNLRESFAESFDLYHRDRAELKRVLPRVHDWFKRGGHVRHLR